MESLGFLSWFPVETMEDSGRKLGVSSGEGGEGSTISIFTHMVK